MDRSHLNSMSKRKSYLLYAMIALVSYMQPTTLNQASANVILTEPSPPVAMGAEEYPESQFGKAPADPVTGQLPLMALDTTSFSQHADAIDQEYGAQRAIAGQETYVAQNPYGGAQRTPAGFNFRTSEAPKPVVIEEPLPNPNSSVFGQKPVMPTTAESMRGIQEVALIANDLGFFPRAVFVTRNTPVRIYVTGASKSTLCLMIDAFNIRKQVRAQKIEEITFTPNVPGTYRYYCPVNGMEGTLVVKEWSLGREDETANAPVADPSAEIVASKPAE